MIGSLVIVALLQKTAGQGGTRPCVNPTCASPPCAAALVGDVGCTTVSGTETYSHGFIQKGGTIASNAHIYGPFEAGFGTRQRSIIEGWGCSDPTVVYDEDGGKDLEIAEKQVAKLCSVQFPRIQGDNYIGIVGPCGGHTKDYHFHVRMDCLYSASGGHSTAVGDVYQYKLYGKWEDYANQKLPLLDACGAHFGPTPESNGVNVYHYHVQDKPPFTVGCVGPTAGNKLVSVAACRALYTSGNRRCTTAPINIETADGTVSYVRWCPCWDANGLNTGTIKELPALSTTDISYTASDAQSTTGTGSTSSSGSTSGSGSGGTSTGGTGSTSSSSGTGGTTTGGSGPKGGRVSAAHHGSMLSSIALALLGLRSIF